MSGQLTSAWAGLFHQAARVRDGFLATLRAALAPGPHGPSWGAGILARPWGLPLGEIRLAVHVWHG